MVEVLRRYSRLPHLRRSTGKLAALVERAPERVDAEASGEHIHRIDVRLGSDALAQLAADYEAGLCSTELQRRYGLGKGTVLGVLRNAGVSMRRRPLDANQVERCVQLYDVGMTIREVARELELPKTTVQDALQRADVNMRPASRRVR